MIYVTSDIHGQMEDLLLLLQQAKVGPEDTLYVLGDAADRGPDGAAMLRWLTRQPNVRFLLGNHENMLLECAFLFFGDGSPRTELEERHLGRWLRNGAQPTIDGLRRMAREEPEELRRVLAALRRAPAVGQLRVGEREFVLVHGGLPEFDAARPLADYPTFDLLWHRPTPEEHWYTDRLTVIGHTPTGFYGQECAGRALWTDTWVDIDTGAGHGGTPMLLRLDDLQEFYPE